MPMAVISQGHPDMVSTGRTYHLRSSKCPFPEPHSLCRLPEAAAAAPGGVSHNQEDLEQLPTMTQGPGLRLPHSLNARGYKPPQVAAAAHWLGTTTEHQDSGPGWVTVHRA